MFYDSSINNSDVLTSDFSNMNIFNSYIYNNPIGYDKSNNSNPAKAVFTDVSLYSLVLDTSLNSKCYIKFSNSNSNSNYNTPIIIKSSDDYSKLEISKPLNIGLSFEETVTNITNISNISVFYGDISCEKLYYSQLFPDVKLNNYFDVSIGEVSVSGNSIPSLANRFNIGSNNLKFNEINSAKFSGFLDGSCTIANDLIKNLDMSFNTLDIYGIFKLNDSNLAQFLSSDFVTISKGITDFSNANRVLSDLSISLYSKAGFDLCLNTNIAKNSLRDASLLVLNNNITSISNSVYSKSDFDLCLNRNLIMTNDVSAVVSVVTDPLRIYSRLGYIDSSLNKVNSAKVSDELVFPYAITYIDDNVEDTNLKEAYSYSATTTKYTITTTTNYIATATANTTTYYDVPVANRQPNDVNLTRAVMVFVRGDNALTPSREKTWSNVSASNTLPAVYVNVRVATPRSVTYQINTSSLTWEQHRINAQQVRGRYLATILNSDEQAAAVAAKGSNIDVWIGGRRKDTGTSSPAGGTIITSGSYIIHRFTNIGISYFTPNFSGSVEVLVVGGGGGGGGYIAGGGGGGGVIYMPSVNVTSGTNYTIFVGDGGRGDDGNNGGGTKGQDSTAFNAIAAGGGTSTNFGHPDGIGTAGGSGGGAAANGTILNRGGDSSGNSLGPNSGTIYGNRGGNMTTLRSGGPTRAAGGGGAGGQGLDTNCNITGDTGQTGAGSGGVGVVNAILGPAHYWAGGGGGGAFSDQVGGYGGLGGGGGGAGYNGGGRGGGSAFNDGSGGLRGQFVKGGDGGANTGGGGGGANGYYLGGKGGSGIVVIRYLNPQRPVNDKSSASWEWHNGDPWGNYENFGTNEPNTRTQAYIQIRGSNRWDDQFDYVTLPALYMTLQLQPIISTDYQGNTELLTWDNHKLRAQEVINRYLATIENTDENTWVANCINAMAIDNTYKDGTGTYIGALRTSNSTASGFSASDWQWSNGTTWNYSNFYRQGATQQVANPTTYTYSSYIPQQPTSARSTPEVNSPITINATNTKIPNIISSVNGSIAVTCRAIGASNLPATTNTGPIIDSGYPSTTGVTTLANNNKQYTTTIQTYTTTLTYAHNGTSLVTSGTATGGNNIALTTNNLYRIHRFTSDGVFTPAFNGTVEVLLVGGGGGGGYSLGGGGGGGGVVYMPVVDVSAGQNYNIFVGSGGSGGTGDSPGTDGNASSAFTAIAAGGGSSGSWPSGAGRSGGSGGGAAANQGSINQGGNSSGNSLGTNSGFIYGSRGGNMTTTRGDVPTRAAGGGGAGGQGLDTNPNIVGATDQTGAGSGGVGIINNILGISHYWAGGGGGGAYNSQHGGNGGFGGGGGGAGQDGAGRGGINAFNDGLSGSIGSNANGGAGGANTGGGGGGGSYSNGQGGRGGDGIVIIRYLIEQPTGSFKISDNSNNNSNYISPFSVNSIPTSYSCIAVTNDGMFVALGKASDVTVYIRNSSTIGWTTIGSPIGVNFSAYTETSVGIIPTQYTDINWRKNLQNLAINYISGSTNPKIFLAFGNDRNSVQIYSYSGTLTLLNGLYSVAAGNWDLKHTHSASTLGESTDTNFGYFVVLSHNPRILVFSVANKFYSYNCSDNNVFSARGSTLPTTLQIGVTNFTNIIALKISADADKIIVSNSYYVFVYKWNTTTSLWVEFRRISLLTIPPLSGQTIVNVQGTGGTVSTSGAYTIHSFTNVGPTIFTISSPVSIDYLVVAGGGSGGVGRGGGGGAGGVKAGTTTLSAGSYTITVGFGGPSGLTTTSTGSDGGPSSIGTLIVTTGGGGGGGWTTNARNGGSGGGASAGNTSAGGTGISGEGFAGFARLDSITGGGGGGAGAAASGKDGAIGISSSITGALRYYAGGGGGGAANSNSGVAFGGTYAGANGIYGGGNGTYIFDNPKPLYTDAVANTGGGGGGAEGVGTSGAGGSGIVVIRYLQTAIHAGPRSLDISNISSTNNDCVFAIGYPDKLINSRSNNNARGYVEYFQHSNNILTRLATLMPRKRDIYNNNVDSDEYYFSAGGIKITNANTIIVAPNFKFHFNSTAKKYELDTRNDFWTTHNSRASSSRFFASIQNEVENELVKISARNNSVWIGGKRVTNPPTPNDGRGKTSIDWQWINVDAWNYQNFAINEPNNRFDQGAQFSNSGWTDLGFNNNRQAIFMTLSTTYTLRNSFTIFNNFFFHSSGFSSSYFPTDISTTVIARWYSRDTSLNPTNTNTIHFTAGGRIVSLTRNILTLSDIRLKENIVDATPKLADLLKVRVVNYSLKGSNGAKLIGVVAQELEELFPSLVNDGLLSIQDINLGKTESYKSVKYSCFDVILIKAFQEQMAIINKLSLQLDELEGNTNSLKTIYQDYIVLTQELDLLKSENELIKLNINEITKLIS
jgi:hypothetical protein